MATPSSDGPQAHKGGDGGGAVALCTAARRATAAMPAVHPQNDFCEGGSLAVTDGPQLAAAIADLVGDATSDHRRIMATRDRHTSPGSDFSDHPEYVHTWPLHCVAGMKGADFHDNFAPAVASGVVEAVFDKGARTGAYSGIEIDELARTAGSRWAVEECFRDASITSR